MHRPARKYLLILAVPALAALGGCATQAANTGEMDALRAQVQAAQRAAERAQATADAAMKAATEANTCCANTTERIDRAFKKSQQK